MPRARGAGSCYYIITCWHQCRWLAHIKLVIRKHVVRYVQNRVTQYLYKIKLKISRSYSSSFICKEDSRRKGELKLVCEVLTEQWNETFSIKRKPIHIRRLALVQLFNTSQLDNFLQHCWEFRVVSSRKQIEFNNSEERKTEVWYSNIISLWHPLK